MPRLAFPAVYICPHVPGLPLWKACNVYTFALDAFNITFVVDDIRQHIGQLANEDIKKLIAYAITGGGMIRAVDALKGVSDVSLDRLREMFLTWLDGRNLAEFYNELFVENGYACNEVALASKCYECIRMPRESHNCKVSKRAFCSLRAGQICRCS